MEGRKGVLKPLTSTAIPVDDPLAAIELFMESGWTDGLPIVPPTPELVRRMVGDSDPQEFIGYIPPNMGVLRLRNSLSTPLWLGANQLICP